MKGVTAEVIAEVRNRASILDVISESVVLKRTGKEHKGLCPFHSEKTPSFHVNPEKGIYKCFGCGEGGDVFAFVQKVKGLEFIDAVRDLALKYGITLVETEAEKKEYDRRTTILMLYQQASEYYAHLLDHPSEGMAARTYLHKRGITNEIITKFKLGYAPNVWDGLVRYLTQATKVAPTTLVEAGLARYRPDNHTYFDLFRNRLIIPIFDEQGRVIAFGGRTLGDSEIKYLNSPETSIYVKGRHLFALHLAKDIIKSRDHVIVVEGYFDAITAHQHGFTNTVASLGTALTDQQAKLLVRYTDSKRVYLGFDADKSGVRATERGMETLNQIATGIGIELRIIGIPGGKDPDECLRSAGTEVFQQAIDRAPLMIDYQLERAINLINTSSHSGRIEASQRIVPILGHIKNAVARGEYIRQWALRLNIREEELLSDVNQYRKEQGLNISTFQSKQANVSATTPLPKRNIPKAGSIEAEQQLLALYLSSRNDYERVRELLAEEELLLPEHQRIKQSIEGIGTQFNTMQDLQHSLMDRLATEKTSSAALVDVILKAEELRKQRIPTDIVLKDSRTRLLKERLLRATTKMSSLLSQTQNEKEQQSLLTRIKQLSKLEKVDLVSISTLEDLDALKHRIEEIAGTNNPETTM